jgi:hypothetical protein
VSTQQYTVYPARTISWTELHHALYGLNFNFTVKDKAQANSRLRMWISRIPVAKTPRVLTLIFSFKFNLNFLSRVWHLASRPYLHPVRPTPDMCYKQRSFLSCLSAWNWWITLSITYYQARRTKHCYIHCQHQLEKMTSSNWQDEFHEGLRNNKRDG